MRARLVVAAAAVAALAWPLAYLAGGRLAPGSGPRAAEATVSSVDVASDPAGACTPGNLLGDGATTLFFGVHAAGLQRGVPIELAITGPARTDDVTSIVPSGRSGCAVIAVPAADDHAQVWAGGDYAVSVSLVSPPTPVGPVTAFEIASGISDD